VRNHFESENDRAARGDRGTRRTHHDLRHGPHELGRSGFGRVGPGRRRSRRGDVRAAVLLLLAESPRNGYQLMQLIEERSQGAWRPSPGSMYPVLSQLEDEGLVTSASHEGGRTFGLTDAGAKAVETDREKWGQPWDLAAAEVGEGRFEVIRTERQVMMATRQVLAAASDAQVKRVAEILKDARRRIYAVLGEEEPPVQ
jgi:DNA-binding PadR family transcriptional regulator